MKILLLYDNFLRDFRGLLLLRHLLKRKGHKVWIRATWNNPVGFAKLMNVDIIVGGQVAEHATHHTGKFAKDNNIRFVLNSTENVTVPEKFEIFITYNTTELNDDIIDLQTIAAKDIYEFILKHPKIKPENKIKYKYLGFPRLDLTINEEFRNIEKEVFRKKYNLSKAGKVYLYISSFLLDGAYDGVPQKDLDKWNFSQMKKMTDDLLLVTSDILTRLVNEVLQENDVLLIKKHPWDCSSFFKDNFQSKKCIVLDQDEYILPCLVNADFFIHTYSTAAIEAWILNLKTVSISMDKYRNSIQLNHMKNELSISTFEELKNVIYNYPKENPSLQALEIFSPNLDGKSTWRLAEEIDKLTPHPHKVKFRSSVKGRMKSELKEWLRDKGYFKYEVDKLAQANTKKHDFYSWENQRAVVIKRYNKYFKMYAKKQIK